MRNNLLILGLVVIAGLLVLSRNEHVVATDGLDRTRLPIAQPAPTPVTEVLPENVPLPTPWEVTAPEGAPNVIIVLLDDWRGCRLGYGQPGAIQTVCRDHVFVAGECYEARYHY